MNSIWIFLRHMVDLIISHLVKGWTIYEELEIKPCGFGSRIEDVEVFWYKKEIFYFVWLCWFCVIVWFTLTLNFWYLKLKNILIFSLRLEADFFLILCYHPRHLQQIHWSKLLCGMYGLMAKSSVAPLNILGLLMRFQIPYFRV